FSSHRPPPAAILSPFASRECAPYRRDWSLRSTPPCGLSLTYALPHTSDKRWRFPPGFLFLRRRLRWSHARSLRPAPCEVWHRRRERLAGAPRRRLLKQQELRRTPPIRVEVSSWNAIYPLRTELTNQVPLLGWMQAHSLALLVI